MPSTQGTTPEKVASIMGGKVVDNPWDNGGQEVRSTWFKFENIGDFIKGTLLNKKYQKSNNPGFKDQWVYEIKVDVASPEIEQGSVVNVGISVEKIGTNERLRNCRVGQIIGIRFDKEGEQQTKGFAKPKFLVVKSWGMDPSFNNFDNGGDEINVEDIPFK